METGTISSFLWGLRIVFSNPFAWLFLRPWIVSSHMWVDSYLAEDSRGTHCRSIELSVLWYFSLKTLAVLAFLDSQFPLLSSGELPVPCLKVLAFLHVSHTSTHQANLGIFSWLWQRGMIGKKSSSLVKESYMGDPRRTISVINFHNQFYDLVLYCQIIL